MIRRSTLLKHGERGGSCPLVGLAPLSVGSWRKRRRKRSDLAVLYSRFRGLMVKFRSPLVFVPVCRSASRMRHPFPFSDVDRLCSRCSKVRTVAFFAISGGYPCMFVAGFSLHRARSNRMPSGHSLCHRDISGKHADTFILVSSLRRDGGIHVGHGDQEQTSTKVL